MKVDIDVNISKTQNGHEPKGSYAKCSILILELSSKSSSFVQ
jgi:hypothetical protein